MSYLKILAVVTATVLTLAVMCVLAFEISNFLPDARYIKGFLQVAVSLAFVAATIYAAARMRKRQRRQAARQENKDRHP